MRNLENPKFDKAESKIIFYFFQMAEEDPKREVTVSALCERARLHRTTFYGHFKDIDEMVDFLLSDCMFFLRKHIVDEEGHLSLDDFTDFFTLGETRGDKRKVLLQYAVLHRKKFPDAEKVFRYEIKKGVTSYWEAQGIHSREELIYFLSFILEGLYAVMRKWVEKGFHETPEEMNRIVKWEMQHFLNHEGILIAESP